MARELLLKLWNEITLSSAGTESCDREQGGGVWGRSDLWRLCWWEQLGLTGWPSVFEHFQEEGRKELRGTLHLHVQEAAGMAGTNHAQVCHLHQQLGPEVSHLVLAVVDVMFESQEELLLTALYPFYARQTWTICRRNKGEKMTGEFDFKMHSNRLKG